AHGTLARTSLGEISPCDSRVAYSSIYPLSLHDALPILFYIKADNYVPFYPKKFQTPPLGIGGISTAAATVFFAFIGFDALAANSAETKDPEKNVVKGIMGTVIIAVLLYVIFSLVLTGMVNYK